MKLLINLEKEGGFSLLEIMVVTGIIGLLAFILTPQMGQYKAKARKAEAIVALNNIKALEEAYFAEKGRYIGFPYYGRSPRTGKINCRTADGGSHIPEKLKSLGLKITCKGPVPRYGYSVRVSGNSKYIARATTGEGVKNAVCPGKPRHSILMSHTGQMKFSGFQSTSGCP